MLAKSVLGLSLGLSLILPVCAQTTVESGQVLTQVLQPMGIVNLKKLAVAEILHTTPTPLIHVRPQRPTLAGNETLALPRASTNPITAQRSAATFGFSGINSLQDDTANGFTTEPPDQGLAVGNGYILEAVNDSLAVYTTQGIQVTPAVGLAGFFGLPAQAFVSDPRAYYDADTQRWFVAEWVSSTRLQKSEYLIAVSQTSDPSGDFAVYKLDATNSQVPGCPCFPDFTQVGADKYGFYLSGNLFGKGSYAGADIYAFSKQALVAGVLPPAVLFLPAFGSEGEGYTILPTITPPGDNFDQQQGGTEYFVSSSQKRTGTKLALWALVNTSSLESPLPQLKLLKTLVNSQTYSYPPASDQRSGKYPQGESLGEPLPKLDSGQTAVLAATYANGKVWAALNTGLTNTQGQTKAGIAYFLLQPGFQGKNLVASILRQGYISAGQNNVIYPSLGINAQGKGAMGFTLVGTNYFPSAAFVPLSETTTGNIQISAVGQAPDDGFTAYPLGGGNGVGRWGDYGAAGVAEDGSVWMANEYIPPLPRLEITNWGTYITQFKP